MSTNSTDVLLGGMLARGLGPAESIRWPLARASRLFELRYGKALVETARRPGRIPVYGTNGQCGSHDTPLFKGPGVVVGRKGQGPLGVEWVNRDFWVIDTAYALSLIADNVNLKFSYYLIKYVGLNHLKDGTSNPSLSRDTFGAQIFPLPPIDEQRGIAATLGALDDKIESNRRLLQLISHLLRAHFARLLQRDDVTWLPFDNVAKRLAVTHKHSGKTVSGRGTFVVLDQSEAGVLGFHSGPPEFVASPAEPICLFGDHTCSWRLGIGSFDVGPNVIPVSTIPSSEVHPTWLYFGLLGAQQFQEYRRHWMELKIHDIPWISATIQREFVGLATPMLALVSQLEAENQVLADIRDALLPELLSGRIRVPEAAESLDEAIA